MLSSDINHMITVLILFSYCRITKPCYMWKDCILINFINSSLSLKFYSTIKTSLNWLKRVQIPYVTECTWVVFSISKNAGHANTTIWYDSVGFWIFRNSDYVFDHYSETSVRQNPSWKWFQQRNRWRLVF